MAKSRVFRKLIFALNWVMAVLLALSLTVPYIPPSKFYNLSLVSLMVAPLLVVNLLFLVYWFFVQAKRIWLSLIVLTLSFFQFGTVIGLSGATEDSTHRNKLTITSFNVRLFNAYEPDRDSLMVRRSMDLLLEANPDVVCLQEVYRDERYSFDDYPYRYEHFPEGRKLGHAIYSRYPISGTKAFDFPNSGNNTLYCDLEINGERIRLYNVHLQSIGILPKMDYLQEGDSDQIRYRLARAFIQQEKQLEQILQHAGRSPYPVIFAGDFNNTPFSYVYRQLTRDYQDAFKERGFGLGTTFWFEFVPMRIDFVFCSRTFDVLDFRTFSKSFSDHQPVTAQLGWPPQP